MSKPLELLATARRLLMQRDGGVEPSETDIRRAISTSYYALFHAVASAAADIYVGSTRNDEDRRAWVHVYRAVDHATIKRACASADLRKSSPDSIANFAAIFEAMQNKRHRADYDPGTVFSLSSAHRDLDSVERALVEFQAVEKAQLSVFLAFALFRPRPA